MNESKINKAEQLLITLSPNPFTNEIAISYEIPIYSEISLKLYNYHGQLVSILVDEIIQQGKHEIQFDARELHSGVYFCVLKTNLQLADKREK